MKPISITIEGINSFIAPQTIDFESVGADNLFCISGSTGSGKSTILDCLIMSLYREEGSRGNLADYINLRCDSGKIDAVFELDGTKYRTVRTIKRKGTNSFVLTNLDSGEVVGEGNDAYDFIKEKIGLEVKEFTKVVVLQQGEFAKFLKADKTERNDLISKLFSLEKYKGLHRAVNGVAKQLQGEIETLERMIEGFSQYTKDGVLSLENEYEKVKTEGDATARLYENAVKTVGELTQRKAEFERMEKLLGEIVALENKLKGIEENEVKAKEVEKGVIALESEQKQAEIERDTLLKTIAELQQVKKTLIELNDKRKAYETDREKHRVLEKERDESLLRADTLKAEMDGLLSALDALKNSSELSFFTFTGDKSDGALLVSKVEEIKRQKVKVKADLDKVKSELTSALADKKAKTDSWAKYSIADEQMANRLAEVKAGLDRAQSEYESAQKSNALAVVCASLKKGDRCPICNGVVGDSAHTEQFELGVLKSAVEKKSEIYEKLRADKEKSTHLIAVCATEIESLDGKIAQLEKQALDLRNEYTALDEKVTATGEILSQQFAQTAKNYDKTCLEYERAQNEYKSKSEIFALNAENLEKREKELIAQMQALWRDEKTIDDELTSAQSRLNQIEKNREVVQAERKKYDDGIKKLAEMKLETVGALNEKKSSQKAVEKVDESELALAIKSESELKAKRDELYKSVGSLESRIKTEKEMLEKKENYAKDMKKVKTEYEKYHDLAKLFYGDGFRNFVVSEYLKDLTVVASAKLSALTGGKYTLEYDKDDFFVYDFLSGNEKRSCKTLSGGETFLASLALAISISDELSKSRNFDFFFIDEGFGTLSPDALDMVIDALKTLSKDTLVGVITHRGELIDRIDAVISVSGADGDEGSKISY